jgi:hypothetical protein
VKESPGASQNWALGATGTTEVSQAGLIDEMNISIQRRFEWHHRGLNPALNRAHVRAQKIACATPAASIKVKSESRRARRKRR